MDSLHTDFHFAELNSPRIDFPFGRQGLNKLCPVIAGDSRLAFGRTSAPLTRNTRKQLKPFPLFAANDKLSLLANGELYIRNASRSDVGFYRCQTKGERLLQANLLRISANFLPASSLEFRMDSLNLF